ncbi:MAG: M20/M25/M40 family metallo-hydrolase [Planctomycetes bacterium]|nr:M20/M25/M40 family metallo-hydrolase [Planctomycetota bacterium]
MSLPFTAVVLSALLFTASPASQDAPPARALLLELTAQPRLAGTIGSQIGADIVAKHLRAAGFQVEIDEREVLLSIPRRIELEIFDAPGATEAVHHRLDRFDPDAIPPGDLPLCNGWSASGEVRAQVVDVGQGLRADFERLKAAGVDVTGKIALARYGGAYRGIKVDLAAQYGCVATLLFHERRADGEVWPAGPWKPGFEGERGSISPMGRTPGDPSTPGWASPKPGEKVRRLEGRALAEALPEIPCIPIGWAEAEKILAALAPRELTGADLKTATKPIGPGPAEVRVLVDQPRDLRTIRNVIATLPGASADCVIAGNHRDAWVRGAHDAGSGTVSLLRAAQRLGERAKSGWKPKHTIKLCFWDAEEFGLIGSTEWGEAHAAWISDHVIAYVNADAAVTGTHFRGTDGTPGLLATLSAALERVPMQPPPADGAPKTMLEDWALHLKGKEPQIGLAGSGSDFAVFLHHLSVPTLDIGLGGNRGGQYHTAFDDFAMVERYLDPGFVGHEMCGQFMAELLTEFTERGRSSFDAGEAARTLSRVALRAGVKPDGSPTWLGPERALRIAEAFDAVAAPATDAQGHTGFYRALALADGIPGRSWYKNPIWTPGLEDGYGSETFPLLNQQAQVNEKALDAAVDELVARIRSLYTAPVKSAVPAPK